MFFLFPHSQQTGSESEGGAAVISTAVLWKWMQNSSASSMEGADNS